MCKIYLKQIIIIAICLNKCLMHMTDIHFAIASRIHDISVIISENATKIYKNSRKTLYDG